MNKKSLILLSLLLGMPLVFALVTAGGLAAGLAPLGILKLIFMVFPVFVLALVLLSYRAKECLYIHIFMYSRDTVQAAITEENAPVLFHFLQLVLLALSIALIKVLISWDISSLI